MVASIKRVLSFALAMVLLFGMVSVNTSQVFAVEGNVVNSGTMLGTTDVTWSYVSNGDGTYTVLVDSETEDAVIPDYNTDNENGVKDPLNFTLVQHYIDRNTYEITKVIFSVNIKKIGTFTVCNLPDIDDVYILNPNAVCSSQAIYAHNVPRPEGLTIHAYTSATVKYAFNGEGDLAEEEKTKVITSYLEAENFAESYGDLLSVNVENATVNQTKIDAAKAALGAMPSAAKAQVSTELKEYVEELHLAFKRPMPDTYQEEGNDVTYRYLKNDDGKYTMILEGTEGGNNVIPTYGTTSASKDPEKVDTYTFDRRGRLTEHLQEYTAQADQTYVQRERFSYKGLVMESSETVCVYPEREKSNWESKTTYDENGQVKTLYVKEPGYETTTEYTYVYFYYPEGADRPENK